MLIYNIDDILPKIKTYSCFSPNQAEFLKNNGIDPIHRYDYNSGSNKKKKYVWVFVVCEELSKLLTQWSDNKPTKKGGGINSG